MEQLSGKQVRLEVQNVGGIERTSVEFEPGVTVLAGRNATNRTSLLQAIMAGLGSDRVSLKGDAEVGAVTLQIGDETYVREIERRDGHLAFEGDPYLEDPELADLFAFLLESNETRRTVALEDDIRDIIMEPVDVEEIKTDIRQLQSKKEELAAEIEQRESLKDSRSELQQRRNEVDSDIGSRQAALADKRSELESLSAGAEKEQDEQSRLERKMETLREKRSELEDVEFRLESQRESLDSLLDERDDIRDQSDEFDDETLGSLEDVRSEISRLREERQRLDTEMSKLQSIIQFNEEMLEGTDREIAAALRGDGTDRAVTDELLEESTTVVCWTCGTEVDQDRIEDTLGRLRELRRSKYGEKQALDEELDARKEEQSRIESRREKRRSVERRLEDIGDEIDDREAKIETLEQRHEALAAEITELETEIEALEGDDQSEVLAVHREVNELEVELDRLENERDRLDDNIAELDARIEEMADLETRRDQVQEELTERRTRIERIEQDAIETFNEHMETVLSLLEYDNLDRIWVERIGHQEGRDAVTEPEFRLNIVRSTDDGVTYEDDFDHLSESEREVTGLIFALAGYLAHDVADVVPFMLLDSLEAIDSERIATLIDYLEEHAAYLVVALLPEDARALDSEYHRVTDI